MSKKKSRPKPAGSKPLLVRRADVDPSASLTREDVVGTQHARLTPAAVTPTARAANLDAIGGVGHSRWQDDPDDNLPRDIAARTKYRDPEVRQLINENPRLALEGLSKLGRVMVIPGAEETPPGFDPLETKARVIGDLRSGHVDNPAKERMDEIGYVAPWGWTGNDRNNGFDVVTDATQIDVTPVYERWMQGGGNDLYEMRLAPPWINAMLLYNNDVGNVWVLHMIASDLHADAWSDEYREKMRWQPSKPATHDIDWERVRWIYTVQVFIGGQGRSKLDGPVHWVKTQGPLMLWRFAIYEDGEPADVHWTHLVDQIPTHKFNNALGTLCEVINMCNCVNVHVAYPDRPTPRAQRRRFERMGVRFSEIHIRPASKSYRGKGEALADMEMPIHGVRGHYATYGKDGKGLLFGKLAGRFWIPPHVRGTAAVGEVVQKYVAEQS